MADDVAERSQPATMRRRQQARRDGVVARSPDLAAAAIFLAALAALAICGAKILTTLETLLKDSLAFGRPSLVPLFQSLAPFVIVIVVACGFAQLLQVGFHFDPARLRPRFGRASK